MISISEVKSGTPEG